MMEQPGHPPLKDSEAELRSGSDTDRPAGERRQQAARSAAEQPGASTAEAIDRATAGLGDDAGTH